jgi:hypothetical protein
MTTRRTELRMKVTLRFRARSYPWPVVDAQV